MKIEFSGLELMLMWQALHAGSGSAEYWERVSKVADLYTLRGDDAVNATATYDGDLVSMRSPDAARSTRVTVNVTKDELDITLAAFLRGEWPYSVSKDAVALKAYLMRFRSVLAASDALELLPADVVKQAKEALDR